MKVHYYTREYSEGMEFPKVSMFSDESTARSKMIDEAYSAAANAPGAYITTQMDGDPVEREDIPKTAHRLNIQWSEDGRIDCFQMGAQEVS